MRGQRDDVNFGQVGTDDRVSQRAVRLSIIREKHVRGVYDAESLQRLTIAQRSTLPKHGLHIRKYTGDKSGTRRISRNTVPC